MRDRVAKERSAGPEDLKVGKGGLMDIEFALQTMQLRFGGEHPELRDQNSFRLVKQITHKGLLDRRTTRILEKNLRFLRAIEVSIHLNSERSGLVLPEDPLRLQAVAASVHQGTSQGLKKTVAAVRAQNNRLFEQVMRQCLK
jgi:glutamate-ammonia-ligase adenylyltransferase